MTTEANLTKSILSWLNKQKQCNAIKMTPSGSINRGQPDIFACYKGQMIVIEVKTLKGSLTALQLRILKKWGRAGAWYMVTRNLESVKMLIEDIDNPLDDYPNASEN